MIIDHPASPITAHTLRPSLRDPLFSVLIPTYNRGHLLAPALDSIAAQTERDFETIVVDDGSTDDTAAKAEAHPLRPRVLRQANAGPAAARNAGLAIAQGAYIAFLDSDDLWMPWSLAAYRQVIEQHHHPSFIAGRPHRFRHEDELSAALRQPLETIAFADYLGSGDEWRWFGVSSFVIRRDALEAVGGFHPARMNGEDADLALRLGVAPKFVQVISPATFGYRQHGGNITGDPNLSLAGLRHMLHAEQTGLYPGGRERRWQCRRIISRHIRPYSISSLKTGQWRDGWRLYRRTALWNLREGRLRYLLSFPFLAAAGAARTLWRSRAT